VQGIGSNFPVNASRSYAYILAIEYLDQHTFLVESHAGVVPPWIGEGGSAPLNIPFVSPKTYALPAVATPAPRGWGWRGGKADILDG